MATIDIGKIKPVFKGTYDNSTAYVLDDIVYYNGSSYVAKTSTTGNLPTDATKWNILASGSGGIYDSTLSLGTAASSPGSPSPPNDTRSNQQEQTSA